MTTLRVPAGEHRMARDRLIGRLGFTPDRFQIEAFDAMDDGRHVVVSAPTGSGKTVVAEYAVEVALGSGLRVFYTAPIKALSNQKYRDLCGIHGDSAIGLLTGDHAIRPDAPIVVMTTEVLRNMIYAASSQLDRLYAVVLDEVHFLQDRYRGPVWEEIIIHLDQRVQLVCLSATVSNADELGEWIEVVRGPTTVITETERPVPLEQLLMYRDRATSRVRLTPIVERGTSRRGAAEQRPEATRLASPRRLETVEALAERGLLPTIFFVFSRNGCDEAADSCLRSGLALTDAAERARIDEIIDERVRHLDPGDLAVLGAPRLRDRLRNGLAAHHAGMVPTFKEIVEACFVEGLIKVVFATETLAVGINMPARSVVIERLSRFTGEQHHDLTPGEYTQLTGRAGRRGIDREGSAVVLWNRFVRSDRLHELATSRAFVLRSVFAPTYNMAVNLVRTYPEQRAHELLGLSFAQFQGARRVLETEAGLRRAERRRQSLEEQATSPYGDLDDYRRRRTSSGRGPIEGALNRLRPGDVIDISIGRHHGPAVVVATGHRREGVQVTLITPSAHRVKVSASDFPSPPSPIGKVRLPAGHAPDRRDYRREVAGRLRRTRVSRQGRHRDVPAPPRHPVEDDPQLSRRLAAARRLDRVRDEIRDLHAERRRQTGLVEQFDAVLTVLERRGFVDRAGWSLTPDGEMLGAIFHESDLLVAESLRTGLLDGLAPPDMAYLVSMFVYEHRSPDEPPPPWFPSPLVAERADGIGRLSTALNTEQEAMALSAHRPPDPTFGPLAHAWVAGERLAEVVADEDLSAGDFVRTMKQVIDLLRQISQVAPVATTRRTCAEAARLAARDVVADMSISAGSRVVYEDDADSAGETS